MNEYVVGVDGSDRSRMALRWAAAAADAAGGRIRAVRSWTHPRSAVLPIAPVPLRGVIPADHPKMVATTAAIAERLSPGDGMLARATEAAT